MLIFYYADTTTFQVPGIAPPSAVWAPLKSTVAEVVFVAVTPVGIIIASELLYIVT